MTKEEAIEVYNGLINTKIKEAFEFFVPELRESEDERIRKWIYAYMMACPNDTFEFYAGVGKGRVLEWLEKQKEQKLLPGFDVGREVGQVEAEQKPVEWSEEDEKMVMTIISDGIRGVELDSKQVDWLKSLKNRGTFPSWKPSEEQLMALRYYLNHVPYSLHKEHLSSLRDDIEKLI